MLKAFLRGIASLGEGFASLFNIWGVPPKNYEQLTGTPQDDYKALRNDWEKVGQDINLTIKQFEKELNLGDENDESNVN